MNKIECLNGTSAAPFCLLPSTIRFSLPYSFYQLKKRILSYDVRIEVFYLCGWIAEPLLMQEEKSISGVYEKRVSRREKQKIRPTRTHLIFAWMNLFIPTDSAFARINFELQNYEMRKGNSTQYFFLRNCSAWVGCEMCIDVVLWTIVCAYKSNGSLQFEPSKSSTSRYLNWMLAVMLKLMHNIFAILLDEHETWKVATSFRMFSIQSHAYCCQCQCNVFGINIRSKFQLFQPQYGRGRE